MRRLVGLTVLLLFGLLAGHGGTEDGAAELTSSAPIIAPADVMDAPGDPEPPHPSHECHSGSPVGTQAQNGPLTPQWCDRPQADRPGRPAPAPTPRAHALAPVPPRTAAILQV
ncbi:hypothetical protein [Streptomyces chengmaiensis]|nr:hypothetical protein [Streptomyces chengmaiensis]